MGEGGEILQGHQVSPSTFKIDSGGDQVGPGTHQHSLGLLDSLEPISMHCMLIQR